MAKLIYAAITSLDLYIEDETGNFAWGEPDAEVHAFVNELERSATTYLYGRRMYETMVGWETIDTGPDQEPTTREFAEIWRAADKVVYSTTLAAPTTARTRVEPTFDPAAVRALKDAAAGDLTVGGATLAAAAFRAGLVDECHLFLHPLLLGGGKPALPTGVRAGLELVDERRFGGGVVYLRYRLRPGSTPPGGA